MKICSIYLLLAVNFVTTIVAYHRRCYEEFSVCLITNTDNPSIGSKFRLSRTSAKDWCRQNSSSLAIITNETIQSALATFIQDSSAKLDSDVITNGYRFILDHWEWTNGRRSNSSPTSDQYNSRYAYAALSTGSRPNATLFAGIQTSTRKFICSHSLKQDYNCRDGYQQFDRKCCKVRNEHVTWFVARSLCLQEGDDLATFENTDLSFFFRWLRNEEYWIGLRKEIWYWAVGERYVEIKYSKWVYNRPWSSYGYCLCITANTGKWTDCDCSQKYRYICLQDYVPDSSTAPLITTTTRTTTTTRGTTSSTSKPSTSTPSTIESTIPTTHTISPSTPTTVADDSSSSKAEEMQSYQDSAMLLAIGVGIACLMVLVAIVAAAVFIKLRHSHPHDPGPRQNATPSPTITITKNDKPNTVYAVVMPSANEPTRSPSERSPNNIVYAELELELAPKETGTAVQESEYANITQPDSVYANCAHTRV